MKWLKQVMSGTVAESGGAFVAQPDHLGACEFILCGRGDLHGMHVSSPEQTPAVTLLSDIGEPLLEFSDNQEVIACDPPIPIDGALRLSLSFGLTAATHATLSLDIRDHQRGGSLLARPVVGSCAHSPRIGSALLHVLPTDGRAIVDMTIGGTVRRVALVPDQSTSLAIRDKIGVDLLRMTWAMTAPASRPVSITGEARLEVVASLPSIVVLYW